MRIAVVTPIPTPYRDPFWERLARRDDVALKVFYCSAGKGDRPWREEWGTSFPREVLPGRNILAWRGSDSSCYWNPGLGRHLRQDRYDALICGGYNHPTMLAAMFTASRMGLPYFLMSETYSRPRPAFRQWIKERVVRRAVLGAAGGFPTGLKARDYLEHYGAKREGLTLIPNTPDVEKIREATAGLARERDRIRGELGLGTKPAALFAGRLIPKKGAHVLLQAMQTAGLADRMDLLVVGDGPEREKLELMAREPGLSGSVHFEGFVQPSEMSRYYAAADLFVLPSSETWGVVVLEALAAGLPVIVTDEVGCHPDVVTSPIVGRVVAARSISALAAALRNTLDDLPTRCQVAEAWAPAYQSMRYDEVAERMISGLQFGLEANAKRARVQIAGGIAGEGNAPATAPRK